MSTEKVFFEVSIQNKYPKLGLYIIPNKVSFYKWLSPEQKEELAHKSVREEGGPFVPAIAPRDGTVHWLSIDRSNWVLRYGKYYTTKVLTLAEVQLKAETGKWLEKLSTVTVDDGSEVCATIFYSNTPT